MALDADTVLWALRGMHDPQDNGVRAHDVARFMSKDATLSEDFSKDDVIVVLESLVADGTLSYASPAETEACAENTASNESALYRFPSGVESLAADDTTLFAEHDGWDHWLGPGADEPRDFILNALAEDANSEVAVKTSTAPDHAEIEPSLRDRADELEQERDALLAERDTLLAERDALLGKRDTLVSERDALVAERDTLVGERDTLVGERDTLLGERDALIDERDSWRESAEAADEEVACLRDEGDELRARVRDLEDLLARERVVAGERLETARRAAGGLARALEDLARLELGAVSHAPVQSARHRRGPRGNWLQ